MHIVVEICALLASLTRPIGRAVFMDEQACKQRGGFGICLGPTLMFVARHEALGLEPIEMYPHPDHIHIDMRTGESVVHGPFTKEEKVIWDQARKHKEDIDEEIEFLACMLKEDPDNQTLRKTIEQNRGISKRTAGLLGE